MLLHDMKEIINRRIDDLFPLRKVFELLIDPLFFLLHHFQKPFFLFDSEIQIINRIVLLNEL